MTMGTRAALTAYSSLVRHSPMAVAGVAVIVL